MLIRGSGDRAFSRFFFGNPKIMLNGEEIRDVIEADDEAGYVVRYCRDAVTGKTIVDRDRYKTERLEGTVVFAGTRRFSPDDARAAAAEKRARRQARNLSHQNRAEVREAGAE